MEDEGGIRTLESKLYPLSSETDARICDQVCGYVGFKRELEHKIIAGADILLMPSRYEPCGLPQLYAQRFEPICTIGAINGCRV